MPCCGERATTSAPWSVFPTVCRSLGPARLCMDRGATCASLLARLAAPPRPDELRDAQRGYFRGVGRRTDLSQRIQFMRKSRMWKFVHV